MTSKQNTCISDLNNDGCLTYNDFLWAKDKICGMSGWKIDSYKYKITEALFKEIWDSLEHIADVNNDGRITQAEWVRDLADYRNQLNQLFELIVVELAS